MAASSVTFVPLATWTRTRDLMTRVTEDGFVVVVDGAVVVGTAFDDVIVLTMRNVAPMKRITMMNTTPSDGW